MARPAKFDEEQILDAALQLISDRGPAAATIGGIARLLHAPVGSIYHRFRSRDELLARLWLRTIRQFQTGFLQALADDNLDTAAVAAALHEVRWVRQNPEKARMLLLYRRQDLLASDWPQDLSSELTGLNADVKAAMRRHARQRFGSANAQAMARLTFALVDVPYAAIRRYLADGKPPPPHVDGLVTETVMAILAKPVT